MILLMCLAALWELQNIHSISDGYLVKFDTLALYLLQLLNNIYWIKSYYSKENNTEIESQIQLDTQPESQTGK